MAKKKSQSNAKAMQKQRQKRSGGSAEIKRAERRLGKALADVDRARERVSRREHDLASLMAKQGRTSKSDSSKDDGHVVAAAAQSASENGSDQESADPADAVPVEYVPAHDGEKHHG